MKKELEKYTKKDEARIKAVNEQEEIRELKKQIRKKKYGGWVQAGKNLKRSAKNVGKVLKNMDKGFGKFIGEDPKKPRKTVEEMIKSLPQ